MRFMGDRTEYSDTITLLVMSNSLFIQAYAYVVVVDGEGHIQAVSSNLSDITGAPADQLLRTAATTLFSPTTLSEARRMVEHHDTAEIRLTAREPVAWGKRQAVVHYHGEALVLEVEPLAEITANFSTGVALREVNESITSATTTSELLKNVCTQLAKLLDYDRVIVYDLDDDGSGVVTEEYNNGNFPNLLGTRYRLDDFPQQAHGRYTLENVLILPDSDGKLARMVGDLSGVEEMVNNCLGCRKVYPELQQFAKESQIGSCLSIALRDEDKLWGMIYGHARRKVFIDHQLRDFAHLVGNLTSQALVYRAFNVARRQQLANELVRTRIREHLASASTLLEGLEASNPGIMEFIPQTTGAAILLGDELVTLGQTPSEAEVRVLLSAIIAESADQEVFSSNYLPSTFSHLPDLGPTAAGVLAIPLNRRRTSWLAWFRTEREQTVLYGSRAMRGAEVHHGRRFEATTEVRRGYAIPWNEEDRSAAKELQEFIRDVMLERYGQLTNINKRLKIAYEELESFSYTVSHDLRAPLRGIDGFAEILMEDYATQIDPEGQALIKVIQQNAARMNQFISDILELSRIGRVPLNITDCNPRDLIREAEEKLQKDYSFSTEITIRKPLPSIRGDRRLLFIVFQHLLSNAVKYTAYVDNPEVEVGFRTSNNFGDGEFYVRDNGIGLQPDDHERAFGMFSRLVTERSYAGNGVGLAITRRILARHNGDIRIESEPGQGATFLFYTDPNVAQVTKPFVHKYRL